MTWAFNYTARWQISKMPCVVSRILGEEGQWPSLSQFRADPEYHSVLGGNGEAKQKAPQTPMGYS